MSSEGCFRRKTRKKKKKKKKNSSFLCASRSMVQGPGDLSKPQRLGPPGPQLLRPLGRFLRFVAPRFSLRLGFPADESRHGLFAWKKMRDGSYCKKPSKKLDMKQTSKKTVKTRRRKKSRNNTQTKAKQTKQK